MPATLIVAAAGLVTSVAVLLIMGEQPFSREFDVLALAMTFSLVVLIPFFLIAGTAEGIRWWDRVVEGSIVMIVVVVVLTAVLVFGNGMAGLG